MYLPAENVEALATESVRMSGIRYWLLDITSPELDRQTTMTSCQSIQNVRAENHLNGAQILELMRRNGWIPLRHRSYTRDSMEVAAARIQAAVAARREMRAGEFPPPPADDPSGVYLLGRG